MAMQITAIKVVSGKRIAVWYLVLNSARYSFRNLMFKLPIVCVSLSEKECLQILIDKPQPIAV